MRIRTSFIQAGCGLFTTLPHLVVARDWFARTCIASNEWVYRLSARGTRYPAQVGALFVTRRCAVSPRYYAMLGAGCRGVNCGRGPGRRATTLLALPVAGRQCRLPHYTAAAASSELWPRVHLSICLPTAPLFTPSIVSNHRNVFICAFVIRCFVCISFKFTWYIPTFVRPFAYISFFQNFHTVLFTTFILKLLHFSNILVKLLWKLRNQVYLWLQYMYVYALFIW